MAKSTGYGISKTQKPQRTLCSHQIHLTTHSLVIHHTTNHKTKTLTPPCPNNTNEHLPPAPTQLMEVHNNISNMHVPTIGHFTTKQQFDRANSQSTYPQREFQTTTTWLITSHPHNGPQHQRHIKQGKQTLKHLGL